MKTAAHKPEEYIGETRRADAGLLEKLAGLIARPEGVLVLPVVPCPVLQGRLTPHTHAHTQRMTSATLPSAPELMYAWMDKQSRAMQLPHLLYEVLVVLQPFLLQLVVPPHWLGGIPKIITRAHEEEARQTATNEHDIPWLGAFLCGSSTSAQVAWTGSQHSLRPLLRLLGPGQLDLRILLQRHGRPART
jgi:hypothetical protein